jgi:NAD(P)H-flavin reductase
VEAEANITAAQQTPAVGPPPMVPEVVRVRQRQQETHDTFTLTADAPMIHGKVYSFLPGQFNMLYVFGVGEVPISMSSDPAESGLVLHTIRLVGTVTAALSKLGPGDALGVRGPFGSSWPAETVRGHDVVIVAGGIGLAPLRPLIYHLLRHRDEYGRVALLYGARSPEDLLYVPELEQWRSRSDFQVLTTVDKSAPAWTGRIGLVTELFTEVTFDPQRTVGMMCGPEIMMRFVVREFEKRGVPDERLFLSLERNMQCAIGFCGHCQFGPNFVCMDGPVFPYDRIRGFFNIREA